MINVILETENLKLQDFTMLNGMFQVWDCEFDKGFGYFKTKEQALKFIDFRKEQIAKLKSIDIQVSSVFTIPSGMGGTFDIECTKEEQGIFYFKILGNYAPHWVLNYSKESLVKALEKLL